MTLHPITGLPEGKVTLEDAKAISQRSSMRYDRDADEHYDILSAFQKSIRGSDPDAAVHYLARLLNAGDLLSPCRRMLVTASDRGIRASGRPSWRAASTQAFTIAMAWG